MFEPDRFFSRVTAIDIQRDLLGVGLDSVLLDIDNTIRSRVTDDIPRDVAIWLGKACDAGVSFCLLSNNWHGNVHAFAEKVDLPLVCKSCKPLPHGFLLAMRKLGAKRANAVAIGDQLLTDVVGAHVVGVKAYMVLPLAEVDSKHTIVLRNVERVLMGQQQPEVAPAPVASVTECDGGLRGGMATRGRAVAPSQGLGTSLAQPPLRHTATQSQRHFEQGN